MVAVIVRPGCVGNGIVHYDVIVKNCYSWRRGQIIRMRDTMGLARVGHGGPMDNLMMNHIDG